MKPCFDDMLESLIRKQDLHYDIAGNDWRDGILLGNGNIGVMAYAPAHLEWVINKVDVFDPTVDESNMLPHSEMMKRVERMERKNTLFLDKLEDNGKGTDLRKTLSAAILRLSFWQGTGWAAPAIPKTSQTLSLFDGELEAVVDAHAIHPRLKMFVPRGTNLFCLRIDEHGVSRSHIIEMIRPANEKIVAPVWKTFENGMAFSQTFPGGKGCYAVAIVVVPTESSSHTNMASDTSITYGTINQTGDADIFISVRTTYDCKNPLDEAIAEIHAAAKKSFDAFESENQKWWHDYWRRGWADFGKYTTIQKYWTFGLYEIASSFGNAPMPGLNGLSYGPLDIITTGVDFQGYTHDQNAQIPSMPLFPLNRCNFISVLADTYLNVIEELRRHTRKLFGCGGIFLPCCMNQLGFEYPVKSYRYTLCGSAYTGLILSLAWRYSRDIKLLREKLYPLIKEFIEFYLGIMRKGEDGIYHLDWSVPPEIFTMTRDDSATITMLRTCLETAVEAATILNCDLDKQMLWKDVLAHYPYPAHHSLGGWWGGPDIPDKHYCFGGHLLYPFFPSEAYTEEKESARKTIEYIEKFALERSFTDKDGLWHHNHEWSAFLTTATRLRLGDKKRAWQEIERFIELFGKENRLFSHDPILILPSATTEANVKSAQVEGLREEVDGSRHPIQPPETYCGTPNPNAKRLAPPVLEGSSALLFLATETLIQSFGGIIRLFPSVPDDFTGYFHKFLAQGAFEVSASMENGRVTYVQIISLKGGTFRLLDPFTTEEKYIVKTLAPHECFNKQS